MSKKVESVRDMKAVFMDYAWNPDIMTEEDARTVKVKQIINTRLSLADKTIILLYADCHSYRKLGARLGVSHMTIRREVKRIKDIILKEYAESY